MPADVEDFGVLARYATADDDEEAQRRLALVVKPAANPEDAPIAVGIDYEQPRAQTRRRNSTVPPTIISHYLVYVVFLDREHALYIDHFENRVNGCLSGGIVHVELHFPYFDYTCSIGGRTGEGCASFFPRKAFSRSEWVFFSAAVEPVAFMRIIRYCIAQAQERLPYNRYAYRRFPWCPVFAFAQTKPRGHLCASLVFEALAAGNMIPNAERYDVREMHAGHIYTLLTKRPEVWSPSEHAVEAHHRHNVNVDRQWEERIQRLPPALQRYVDPQSMQRRGMDSAPRIQQDPH